MGVCDVPVISTVCDVAGEAAATVVAAPFDWLAQAMGGAAGWLIERAGWKGFRDGDAAVHRLQALVLVNHGHATGAQLLALAQRIQGDVLARFGVALEIEPNVL